MEVLSILVSFLKEALPKVDLLLISLISNFLQGNLMSTSLWNLESVHAITVSEPFLRVPMSFFPILNMRVLYWLLCKDINCGNNNLWDFLVEWNQLEIERVLLTQSDRNYGIKLFEAFALDSHQIGTGNQSRSPKSLI